MAPSDKTMTIQDVSRCSGVPTHTLRFWEKELKGVILPERTKGGQRRYTQKHLLVIEDIKSLKDRGMSLSDIQNELSHRFTDDEQHNEQRADVLANKIAEIVRSVIFNYLENKAAKE